MENPFTFAEWQPSKPPAPNDDELSMSHVVALVQQLNAQAKTLAQHPYDPHAWLQRSHILSRLRYPELALGDAYKAGVLCAAHLSRFRDGQWQLGQRMGFWMHEDAETGETSSLLNSRLKALLRSAETAMADCIEDDSERECGKFRRRAYPWMPDCFSRRKDGLLEQINGEMAEQGREHPKDSPRCVVKRHHFRGDSPSKVSEDVLGVFAACGIDSDQGVIVDRTRVWGCSGPVVSEMGQGCDVPNHPNPDGQGSKADFGWIRDKFGSSAAAVLRSCRLLECCVQDQVEHPLQHPLVARMTPTYPTEAIDTFSLAADVVVPNEALRQLGIDVFADQRYDTWVIQTIEARSSNNNCTNPVADLLCPLFCLFNHSCEPNAAWTIQSEHREVEVRANRDIREGEQLFVTYDDYLRDKTVEERRQGLWRWLDGPCQCTRCVREEYEATDRKLPEARSGADRASRREEWDVAEKAVLPEDMTS